MTPARVKELLALYRSGQLTRSEWEALSAALENDPLPGTGEEDLDAAFIQGEAAPLDVDTDHAIWSAIRTRQQAEPAPVVAMPQRGNRFSRRWTWAAAAAVLVLAGTMVWMNNRTQNTPSPAPTASLIETVQPGKDGAILELADGSQLVLDSMGNGVVASQNGVHAVLKNGALSYTATGTTSNELLHNRIITPLGRQFYLVLSDGTKAWLNAGSSLHYPVQFAANERRIEITGEVYLEVSRENNRPFYVQVKDQGTVRSMGTSFNINAYEDEAVVSTTLLEGAVEVVTAAQLSSALPEKVMLQAGQQAQVARTGAAAVPASPNNKVLSSSSIRVISNVDTDKVMAWKNGVFNFDQADLQQVMKQLARWYNLDIEYQQGIPNMRFGGKMSRDLKLAQVLDFLEATGVRFRMEEKGKLIVLPKEK